MVEQVLASPLANQFFDPLATAQLVHCPCQRSEALIPAACGESI